MSMTGGEETNPYQSPLGDAEGARPFGGPIPDPGMVRKFREQIHALGALWIFLALLTIGLAAAFLAGSGMIGGQREDAAVAPAIVGVLAVLGGGWLALGVFACLKQIWAVYVGLVLSYLLLVALALSLNVCPLILLVLAIPQAHRVLRWANQMQAAGVPLTAKP